MSDESEHSEDKFYYPGKLSNAELLQSPTHSESTERKSTLLTTEEIQLSQKLTTSKEAVKKTTFPDDCLIINLWNKQTVLRRNFFQWKASIKEFIVGQKQENWQVVKKKKYNINIFFEFPEFREEKSQTYLVYSRINCSAVSTSVLFEERKLSTNTSSLLYSSSR